LRLRCAVPPDALPVGGLTIYGAECGRYPVCPTVIVEW
jgi:predicted transcriptional regulator